mmetsp:Transcript_134569/g.375043  ORF Transcript_134569/g.375043 Transcript_134569/m.375043 type:complete len:372 (-) Transcript_134569:106-1221(-)
MGAAAYRFQVGDDVLCKVGQTDWEAGKVVQLSYRNPETRQVHPYQVHLFSGRLIFVPRDDEELCKRLEPAWWEKLFRGGELSNNASEYMLQVLSQGQDANAKNWIGDTALLSSIRCEWLPGVQALLLLRADPNVGGRKQERPLKYAVSLGEAVVRQLLEARADPNLQDEDPDRDPESASKSLEERQWHRTPLHYAAQVSAGVARALLENRADLHVRDAQCKQPLHLAIEEENASVVDLLLRSRADVNTGNAEMGMNSTCLIEAIGKGDAALATKLIRAKADVNKQGKQGMTALHMAARCRRPNCVELLVEASADVNLVAMGKTAGELAATNNMSDVAELLGYQGASAMATKKQAQDAPELDDEMRKQLFLD